MVTRKDIEDLGFYYYGDSSNHTMNGNNIEGYSIKLVDGSYCHIHFFDNNDGFIRVWEIETTDMYGGADRPFAGYREGGSGPRVTGGPRIKDKNYLNILLDVLGVVGEDYDSRDLSND